MSSGGLDAILGVMLGLSSAGEQNEVKNPQIPTAGLAAAGELRGGVGALWGRTEKVAKGSIRAAGGFVPRVLPKKLKSAGMGARLPGRRTLEVSVLSRPWFWEELGNTLQGRQGGEGGKWEAAAPSPSHMSNGTVEQNAAEARTEHPWRALGSELSPFFYRLQISSSWL